MISVWFSKLTCFRVQSTFSKIYSRTSSAAQFVPFRCAAGNFAVCTLGNFPFHEPHTRCQSSLATLLLYPSRKTNSAFVCLRTASHRWKINLKQYSPPHIAEPRKCVKLCPRRWSSSLLGKMLLTSCSASFKSLCKYELLAGAWYFGFSFYHGKLRLIALSEKRIACSAYLTS